MAAHAIGIVTVTLAFLFVAQHLSAVEAQIPGITVLLQPYCNVNPAAPTLDAPITGLMIRLTQNATANGQTQQSHVHVKNPSTTIYGQANCYLGDQTNCNYYLTTLWQLVYSECVPLREGASGTATSTNGAGMVDLRYDVYRFY
ncbi:hypothetical protein O6H91_04G136500 [Diphasiastrum complanatum]|uniref:Uncharacterized protein n=1 Tax=Diphasiastrum complanatum TaxID=34168 RepID=A0ACC2E1W6_DIPCM|nr:hypothetical protein O6H91_04G136500 [Diphasiastrum complanatum]